MELKIINADVYSGLNYLEDNTVDCAVTSPPYWGQRDYGFDGQIGNENTYIEYISKLVVIYNKLREKISERGIFFLNIGDKYISKYGKSPLGLIPYKLAYFMVKDGWILNDILIWYKPNHMPSSIKNRFTNTYEPVFVFSKSKNNYYTENSDKKRKILKIKVQLTSYKHVATYPEKLVEELLLLPKLPEKAIVLDPFAGSGTTGKAVININEKLIYKKTLSCIMIERFEEFVNIIKERCEIYNNKNIVKLPYSQYNIPEIKEPTRESTLNNNIIENPFNNLDEKRGMVEITDSKEKYLQIINLLSDSDIKNNLRSDSTLFIASKSFDIETIYKTSLLNDNGWVIRNMLIVNNKDDYYPIFMIVDDNKKYNYLFNIEKIRIKHKHNNNINWKTIDFKEYKVYDRFHKEKKEGFIVDVLSYYNNNFPELVSVLWDDNSFSKEYVIYEDDEINNNIDLLCAKCKNKINVNNYDPFKENKCNYCSSIIWENTLPIIKENKNITKDFNIYNKDEKNTTYESLAKKNNGNNTYNGKFKNISNKINFGASPGARASTQEVCFSVRRLYNVNQSLICDYLNYKRLEKKLSKKALTDLFPKSYKHTVGHWLRKDFGGSLPLPSDWKELEKILDLDKTITDYVCRTGIKLQTVKSSNKGKNIGDYLENLNGNIKTFLTKVYS